MTNSLPDVTAARRLFAMPCDFVLAAASSPQFPKTDLSEVAFIGRSNVGKSSLINALVNRKRMARASNTPGRTQQIVFFNLGQRLMLVDLPGYGFANAPHAEKEHWNELVSYYLRARPKLRCVCLLIDGRHGLLSADLEMMALLDRAAAPYRVILTKSDKVRMSSDIDARKTQIEESLRVHAAAHPSVHITSSDNAKGIEELRVILTQHSV